MAKKKTLKFKDFNLPKGQMSKIEDKPTRPTMYDIDSETRRVLKSMRTSARGGNRRKK
jgi:hypothetical protein